MVKLQLPITLISFLCAGTPAMLRSEVNDTNTNIPATLVCISMSNCQKVRHLKKTTKQGDVTKGHEDIS